MGSGLAGVVWLLGGYNKPLQFLIIFICLDYLTGVLSAIYLKKISSKIGLRGIVRKVGLLTLVVIANLLSQIINDNGWVYQTVIYFLIANEGISIIENLVLMNLPIPSVIKNALTQVKDNKK